MWEPRKSMVKPPLAAAEQNGPPAWNFWMWTLAPQGSQIVALLEPRNSRRVHHHPVGSAQVPVDLASFSGYVPVVIGVSEAPSAASYFL